VVITREIAIKSSASPALDGLVHVDLPRQGGDRAGQVAAGRRDAGVLDEDPPGPGGLLPELDQARCAVAELGHRDGLARAGGDGRGGGAGDAGVQQVAVRNFERPLVEPYRQHGALGGKLAVQRLVEVAEHAGVAAVDLQPALPGRARIPGEVRAGRLRPGVRSRPAFGDEGFSVRR
jgi:hypothetical protein